MSIDLGESWERSVHKEYLVGEKNSYYLVGEERRQLKALKKATCRQPLMHRQLNNE